MTVVTTQVRLGYRGSTVVPDLTLSIEDGSFVTIVGANGSGKSTLLYGLARILSPQSGLLTLDGRDFADWTGRDFARSVAILPQHPVAPEGLTVAELVNCGRHPHRPLFGRGDPAGPEVVARAIEQADLSELSDRHVSELSGGERQRAWLAMALAQQARVLLLDEPTSYLDIRHQLELMSLLHRLNRDLGLTIVATLHDLGQAARYADRLIAVSGGRVVADGAPRVVLTDELLASVFGVQGRVLWDEQCGLPVCIPIAACPPQPSVNAADTIQEVRKCKQPA